MNCIKKCSLEIIFNQLSFKIYALYNFYLFLILNNNNNNFLYKNI